MKWVNEEYVNSRQASVSDTLILLYRQVFLALEHEATSVFCIIPIETGLAMLKGAVMFGHYPSVIMSRVSRYTYGGEVINEFEPGLHPHEYKIYDTYVNKYKCKHIFEAFVQSDEHIPVDHVAYIYDCIDGFGVYASTHSNPQYTVEMHNWQTLEMAEHHISTATFQTKKTHATFCKY